MITIEEATSASPELVAAIQRLLPQLSGSARPPGEPELAAIVDSDASILFVARDGDAIVGSLTLVVFAIPTGTRAWIEDVVVDETARGKGVGAALNAAALARAAAEGAKTVDLSSRPSREAANRLYQRLGFLPRDTNVYRFEI